MVLNCKYIYNIDLISLMSFDRIVSPFLLERIKFFNEIKQKFFILYDLPLLVHCHRILFQQNNLYIINTITSIKTINLKLMINMSKQEKILIRNLSGMWKDIVLYIYLESNVNYKPRTKQDEKWKVRKVESIT